MKKILNPVLFVLLGLTTLAFTPAKEAITLRLHPEQGKTYTINAKMSTMTLMDIQGQMMTMNQSMETKQTFTAKEVTSLQCILESQLDAMKLTISQMGIKLTYDSENPKNTSPMLAGQIDELSQGLKKPFTQSFDAFGQVINDSTDISLNQLAGVIINLPIDPITEGSTWTSKKELGTNGMETIVEITYTVTSISKKKVEITYTGSAETEDISVKYNGNANLNPQTGMIVKSTTNSTISTTINEEGISIPITATGTNTVTLE